MIHHTIEGHIASITLDDPTRHNALDHGAIAEIMAALDDVDASDARVLILAATGRSFCAGARLDQLGDGGLTENPFSPLCDRLESFRLPTIAALQGGVFGAGVELALSCDYRIGVEGMKAAVPASELGIHYTQAGIGRVVAKLGGQIARRVFLDAERFTDTGLLGAGFLDNLVAPEALDSAVAAKAERLASLAPLAVQGMKASIVAASDGATPQDFADAQARIDQCFASADHQEGVKAKAEKRTPVFSGR
ncbi:MAG: enoyl-CoA hydratase-related protein [Pseudomonadota bacterium]